MKRSIENISSCVLSTRSKNPILLDGLKPFKRRKRSWVSATQLKNYIMKDTLVDWLKLKQKPIFIKKKKNTFNNYILEKGHEFESNIIKYININKHKISSLSNIINREDNIKHTIELIKKGEPIIHSGALQNNYNNTGGFPDLIIRSDYLHKIVDHCPLNEDEIYIPSPKLNKLYHYLIVDIKFATIPLRSDGKHILNSGLFKAYKSQLWIYNQALAKIQGYTPRYAFLLGRRWNYKNKNGYFSSLNCLNKLGVIDFKNIDKDVPIKSKEAIKWVRKVRNEGHKWTINPPTVKELYPNMNIDSGKWNMKKKEIAKNIGEITQIWFCNTKNRDICISKGITSIKDKNCNSDTLGIKGIRKKNIDMIIKINQQDKLKIMYQPLDNTQNWKKTKNNFYVDFETITDIFSPMNEIPIQNKTNQIFMIGVGWEENGIWKYKHFTCKSLSLDEEYTIMNDFCIFLYKNITKKDTLIYFWNAECKIWNNAQKRQYERNDVTEQQRENISNNWSLDTDIWFDLYKLFTQSPIVIKDCYNYKLKNIAKNMYNHGLIKTKLESNCNNGMLAAVNAYNIYMKHKHPLTSKGMKDIIKYNEFDVCVLWDIIKYLKK